MQRRQAAGCCPGVHVGTQLGHQEAEGLVLPGDGRPVDGLCAQGVPRRPASLMLFEQQLGHIDVAALNRVHEGCAATPVRAVGSILAPLEKDLHCV